MLDAAKSLVANRNRANSIFFVAFDFEEYEDCKFVMSFLYNIYFIRLKPKIIQVTKFLYYIKPYYSNSSQHVMFLDNLSKSPTSHSHLHDKRDNFNLNLTKYPFLRNNMPPFPVYRVLSRKVYDMPGLAPQIDVLFLGQRYCPIRFSTRFRLGRL